MSASHLSPVTVVFAANDYYVPYLSTLLTSLLNNSDPHRTYEFIVLSEDLTSKHEDALRRWIERSNVSLRVLNVAEAMKPYQAQLKVRGHFKIETYFRLLLPQLLPNHHKVLYLDADMVCLRDVAALFDTDLGDCLVGACKDADTAGIYNGVDLDLEQPDKKHYMDDVLKIKNPYEYFQAGTLLFNLDAWRTSIDVDEVFRFAQLREWQLLDQDVLNYFCQGRVRFLDMAWNVMYDFDGVRVTHIISKSTPELRKDYMNARKNPFIVHYAGPTKPWMDPDCDFAPLFWQYARESAFYEVIVHRMLHTPLNAELERIDRDLKATQDYLVSVDAELQRYEHRPLGLMVKEFVYQKLLTPVVERATGNNEDAKCKVHTFYRKIHPRATE
ncbi:MAG: glycosyltransferase family 8 protein [Atopobiaceae bacterium]|nr:glycosyltransferase family 8 protein [Atopobiaceae bacterium]